MLVNKLVIFEFGYCESCQYKKINGDNIKDR